jgi:muramidase (phage lysozyme)
MPSRAASQTGGASTAVDIYASKTILHNGRSQDGGLCLDRLAPDFITMLAAMLAGAQSAGHKVRIGSAFRSRAHQIALKGGAKNKAKVGSADGSLHRWGLAVDLTDVKLPAPGFLNYTSAASKWVHANAGKYGLNVRMLHTNPFEPWHVEPVGALNRRAAYLKQGLNNDAVEAMNLFANRSGKQVPIPTATIGTPRAAAQPAAPLLDFSRYATNNRQTALYRRGFLDVIAACEGTDPAPPRFNSTQNGYDLTVGYGKFTDFSRHPGLRSKGSASGRYQWLNSRGQMYWDEAARNAGRSDFSPASQDYVTLISVKSAWGLIDAGDIKGAVHKFRKRWASFPGAGYGQQERSWDFIDNAWKRSIGAALSAPTENAIADSEFSPEEGGIEDYDAYELAVNAILAALFDGGSGGSIGRVLRHRPHHPVTGGDVSALQAFLGAQGAQLTGVYDQEMENAVKTFQRSVGLPPSGVWGRSTTLAAGLSWSGPTLV